MIKKIKTKEEYYLEFTKEELAELDINEDDKFEWIINDDGSVLLKKLVKLDIGNIKDYSREFLETIILKSLEEDITVNDVIVDYLKQIIETHSPKKKKKK
jgi:hypothetical protein